MLVVPESPSILRSVTKLSVCDLARRLGWTVERRPLAFEEVKAGKFQEFMAAGTAAGITPVRSISYNSKAPLRVQPKAAEGPDADEAEQQPPKYEDAPGNEILRIDFGDGQTAGANAVKLWSELTSYQCGDSEDTFGWLWPKEGIMPEDAIKA